MKIFIGGEIENDVYEKFREVRNFVLNEFDKIQFDFDNILELSFYVFLQNDFETIPQTRYKKSNKRLEIEIVLCYDEFKISTEMQCINIILQSISNAMSNYKNKHINQNTLDYIKDAIEKLSLINKI